MKFKLPILAVPLLLKVALLASPLVLLSLPQPAHAQNRQALPSRQSAAAASVDGQSLVRQAVQRMWVQPRLEANVRQRIDLFGQQLSGPGYYAQFGDGSGKVRLQLKLALNGEVASFQQISDGRFLYTHVELPNSNRRVSFVDAQRIRKALQQSSLQVTVQPSADWMALGGLSHLLRQLADNFEFGAPAADTLGDAKVPVWTVIGIWKKEKLAEMLPEQKDALLAGQPANFAGLADNVPHAVELTLGRDEPFPLFPYRIVYHQQVESQDQQQKVVMRPVLILELFNVRYRADMKESEFDYEPDDNELVDQTDGVLKRLGLKTDGTSLR